MSVNYNALASPGHADMDPGGPELNQATVEALQAAQIVRFSPPQFHKEGYDPKQAGEFHNTVLVRQPDAKLTFSVTSAEGYNGDPGWMDLGAGGVGSVWVVTDSGNKYAIGDGYVYNHNAGGVYALDPNAGQVQLNVGEPANIPGAGTTSVIKSVLINDEINDNAHGYSWTGKDADAAPVVNSPFDPLIDFSYVKSTIASQGDVGAAIAQFHNDINNSQSKASFV